MCCRDQGKSNNDGSLADARNNGVENQLTITTVRVDGLEEAEGYPDVNREDVQVAREVAIENGACNGPRAENEDFSGMRIFGGKAEWRRVLVVDLVNVLIEHTGVQCLMGLVRAWWVSTWFNSSHGGSLT